MLFEPEFPSGKAKMAGKRERWHKGRQNGDLTSSAEVSPLDNVFGSTAPCVWPRNLPFPGADWPFFLMGI